ncbi:MAG: CDP-glycerol glycerophosphotransferase family protein [Bacteroidetes bacterium]|nr:CDP-glycerol glycerophosphotransferase family protein [Bacteroidota bacterium]
MIRILIQILNKILFKKERVVIQVFPNFEDNGVALAYYLDKNYKIPVFFINPTKRYSNFIVEKTNVKVLPAKSIKGVYYLVTSKYIFFTHGSVLKSYSKKQVVTNLWHGYGYKPVGKLIGLNGTMANITAATSLHCQDIFSTMFDVPIESVKITGFPRNDRLFLGNKKDILTKLGFDYSKFTFFWLPTFRKSVTGYKTLDGIEAGNAFGINGFDIDFFNSFLEQNNAFCLIKPHPMAPKYESSYLGNIKIIDDNFLHDNGFTLYPVLGACDCLISDLSSVIVDFTLVNKPIVCYMEDMVEYKNSRGFIFDNIEDYIPGPLTRSKDQFYKNLLKVLEGKDEFKMKREKLTNFFHFYKDRNSAKRVVEELFKSQSKSHLN